MLELRDAADGWRVRVLAGAGSWVRGAAFSPNGVLLAAGLDDAAAVVLWRLSDGAALPQALRLMSEIG